MVGEAGLMSACEVSECWIMSASNITAQYLSGQWPKKCSINKHCSYFYAKPSLFSSEAEGWGQKIIEFQRFKSGQK